MEFLVLFALATLLVWSLVALKFQERSGAQLLPMLGVLVLVSGGLLGSDFFQVEIGPIPVTIERGIIFVFVVLFGIFWFRGGESVGPLNRSDLLLVSMIAVLGWSAFAHDWRYWNNLPVSRLLFLYLLPFAVYLVMRSVKLGVADLKWVTLLLGAFGIYLAFTAIAETREWTSLVFPGFIMTSENQEFLGRGRGPFLNPVSNGAFLVACSCAILMWWFVANDRVRGLIVAIMVLMSAGAFCTLTRSVWLGFLLAVGMFAWFPATRRARGAMMIAAVVIVVISFPLIQHRVHSFKRDKQVSQAEMEKSAQLRPLFALVAWRMFQDRPVYGCGFGQYARAKYPYLQDPHSGKPLAMTKSWMQHNVFLAFVTETGLVGMMMLVAVLAAMGMVGYSVWCDPRLDPWARRFGLLFLAVLLNYIINGMFHDVSIMPMQNMLLMFLFGIVNNLFTSPQRCAIGWNRMAETVRSATRSQESDSMSPGLPATKGARLRTG